MAENLDADLSLSISDALNEVDRLEAAIAAATTVELQADASEVITATEAAVADADTLAEVEADASEVTAAIDSAVDDADTLTEIDGDASEVTTAIDSAVDAADTTTEVEADASEVTSEIDSAIDAADAITEVTANADDVTASIDAAVDGADTHVEVTADDTSQLTNSLNESSDAAAGLQTNLVQIDGTLGRIAQVLSVAVVAGQIRSAVLEAEALNSQIAITEQIIAATGGAARLTADELRGMAEALSVRIGVDVTEILAAQNVLLTFRDVGRETFGEVIGLAFDMAAVLGTDASSAVLQLGKALNDPIRGTTALTRAGVQFTDQQQDQIAALVESGDVLGAQNIILDELRNQLAGTAEASADTTAKIAVAGAEVRRAFGQPLIAEIDRTGASITEAVARLEPLSAELGQNLAPILGALAGDLLPAVLDAVVALSPALGTTTTLISALAPVISALAATLEAIPDPVIQAVAAFALLQRLGVVNVLTRIGSALTTAGLSAASFAQQARAAGSTAVASAAHFGTFRGATAGLGSAFTRLASSIGPGVLATAGLTAALLVLSHAQQRAANLAAEHRERVETLRAALAESGSVTRGITSGFEQLAESSDEAAQAIAAAGFTAAEFTDLAVEADNLNEATRDLAEAAGIATLNQNDLGRASQNLLGDINKAVAAADELARSEIEAAFAAGELTEAKRDQLLASENVIAAWEEESQAVQQAEDRIERLVKAEIDAAKAQGEITAEQARGVLTADDLEAAWADLQAEIEGTNEATNVSADILRVYRDAAGATAQANVEFAEALRTVNIGLSDIETATRLADGEIELFGVDAQAVADTGVASLEDGLTRLALAFDSGAVSAEDLEAAAVDLGVNVEDLQPALQAIAETVNGYASSARSAVSDTSALAESMTEGFDIDEFFADMEAATEATENFQDNLATLADEGFAELAALAVEQGPAFAQALIDAFEEGGAGALEEFEAIATGSRAAIDDLIGFIIAEFGPELAQALGLTAEQAAAIFGENYDAIPEEVRKTDQEMLEELEGSPFPTFAGDLARRGRNEFESGIAPMPGEAGSVLGRTVDAVLGRTGSMGSAGRSVGRSASDGMASGASSAAGRVGAQVSAAIDGVLGRRGSASSAGRGVGVGIGDGMSSGIRSRRSSVINAAADVVESAISAAQNLLGISSPSRVFAEIGSQTGEGFALGLADSTSDVVREAEAITRAAAAAASGGITVDPAVTGALASASAGAGGTVINVEPGAVVVQLPPGTTPAQAEQLTAAAGRGFLSVIARRQVLVDARTT